MIPIKRALRRAMVPVAALVLALAGVLAVPGAQGGPGVGPPAARAAYASCSGSYSVKLYAKVVRTDLDGNQAASDVTGYRDAGSCWKFKVTDWSPTGYPLKDVSVGVRVGVCGHLVETIHVVASSYTAGPFDVGSCNVWADNVTSTASTSVSEYLSVPGGTFYATVNG